MRRTPKANIRAERPVDLGLHDPFLPVMGEIEQFRALKLRKTPVNGIPTEGPVRRRERLGLLLRYYYHQDAA
jgi:hypothetical protein